MLKTCIFDLDDTLWGLNLKVSRLTGIDIKKIDTYSIETSTRLTKDEIKSIKERYFDPMTWKNIEYFDGIERLANLKNFGARVIINSNCANQAVVDYKRSILSKDLGIPDDQIILNVITPTLKKNTTGAFIFVDDSSSNIESSKAQHNLVLDTSWNHTILSENYERFTSLNGIIDRCEELLRSYL